MGSNVPPSVPCQACLLCHDGHQHFSVHVEQQLSTPITSCTHYLFLRLFDYLKIMVFIMVFNGIYTFGPELLLSSTAARVSAMTEGITSAAVANRKLISLVK